MNHVTYVFRSASDNSYMKHSTPILDAVKAMHREEDQGIDPYNTARVRALKAEQFRAAQVKEAEDILACYETQLTVR